MMIAKSLDNGATWETSKVVAKSAGLVWAGHCAVAPDGNIGVMWYDTLENVPKDGEITVRVYFAISKDDGGSCPNKTKTPLSDIRELLLIY